MLSHSRHWISSAAHRRKLRWWLPTVGRRELILPWHRLLLRIEVSTRLSTHDWLRLWLELCVLSRWRLIIVWLLLTRLILHGLCVWIKLIKAHTIVIVSLVLPLSTSLIATIRLRRHVTWLEGWLLLLVLHTWFPLWRSPTTAREVVSILIVVLRCVCVLIW